MSRTRKLSRCLWLVTLCLGCEAQGAPARPAGPAHGGDAGIGADGSTMPGVDEAGAPDDIARSSNSSLQWKRYAAFEADLSAALALPKESLCKELGKDDCIRGVHLSPLGGHDPFRSGLLEPSAEPLATTPSVVERIVLSACAQRAELDRKAGSAALVFKGLDLAGRIAAPDSEAVQSLITDLYRRFLARDPEPEERTLIGGLSRDESDQPIDALSFAKVACFVVGTSSEFLFF